MQHDCTSFKDDEIAIFIGWNLTKRMKLEMCALFQCGKRNKPNLIGLFDLFQCPSHECIARQAFATIG
jgi:hypothetical protein